MSSEIECSLWPSNVAYRVSVKGVDVNLSTLLLLGLGPGLWAESHQCANGRAADLLVTQTKLLVTAGFPVASTSPL